jgi:hypothetical protein
LGVIVGLPLLFGFLTFLLSLDPKFLEIVDAAAQKTHRGEDYYGHERDLRLAAADYTNNKFVTGGWPDGFIGAEVAREIEYQVRASGSSGVRRSHARMLQRRWAFPAFIGAFFGVGLMGLNFVFLRAGKSLVHLGFVAVVALITGIVGTAMFWWYSVLAIWG